jgi:hypothetical protein
MFNITNILIEEISFPLFLIQSVARKKQPCFTTEQHQPLMVKKQLTRFLFTTLLRYGLFLEWERNEGEMFWETFSHFPR